MTETDCIVRHAKAEVSEAKLALERAEQHLERALEKDVEAKMARVSPFDPEMSHIDAQKLWDHIFQVVNATEGRGNNTYFALRYALHAAHNYVQYPGRRIEYDLRKARANWEACRRAIDTLLADEHKDEKADTDTDTDDDKPL